MPLFSGTGDRPQFFSLHREMVAVDLPNLGFLSSFRRITARRLPMGRSIAKLSMASVLYWHPTQV
jgi:hypothetical protein